MKMRENRFDYVIPEKQQGNMFNLPYSKRRDNFGCAHILAVPFEKPLTLIDFKIEI